MNRRRFLELMGMTIASGAVAYSFPSIIVPRNIIGLTMLDVAPMNLSEPIVISPSYYRVDPWIEFYMQQMKAAEDYWKRNAPTYEKLLPFPDPPVLNSMPTP